MGYDNFFDLVFSMPQTRALYLLRFSVQGLFSSANFTNFLFFVFSEIGADIISPKSKPGTPMAMNNFSIVHEHIVK